MIPYKLTLYVGGKERNRRFLTFYHIVDMAVENIAIFIHFKARTNFSVYLLSAALFELTVIPFCMEYNAHMSIVRT